MKKKIYEQPQIEVALLDMEETYMLDTSDIPEGGESDDPDAKIRMILDEETNSQSLW